MLEPNTVLQGRYRIVSLIAQGGMGAVYQAVDQRLGNTVALKETFFNDEMLLKAFEREARLLAGLRHSSLPVVSDHFSEREGQFLVMEYIPGDDLGAILKKRKDRVPPKGVPKPFDPDEVISWAEQLLDALDYIHTQTVPVIHRDIKPQNIKPTGRGRIVLLDFGLAKGSAGFSQMSGNKSIQAYTPNYAPLEQIQGAGTDARSDLYSLAATLFHLITGVLPPDALSRCLALTRDQPDPLQCANEVCAQAPNAVSAVLYRAMALKREDRYSSAAEMLRSFREAARVAQAASVASQPQITADAPTLVAKRAPALEEGQFTIVKVDDEGRIAHRLEGKARFFREDLGKDVTLEMVSIPAGEFLMGSPADEEGRSGAEGPQHQVALPAFFMSRYTVTQAQWKRVARLPEINKDFDSSPAFFTGNDLPVEQVSWEDAVEFCERLTEATGRNYRLPSEAEWEYACRAFTSTPFHLGPTISTEVANYNGKNPYGKAAAGDSPKATSEVGGYKAANTFGLYDMHGNVWEWCQDRWHESYEGAPADGSAWQKDGDEGKRVLRGGAWGFSAASCRSANRYKFAATGKNYLTGFRVVVIDTTTK
ncbi:MAG: SUMF1/EgtB/PvdO family nonheme iron enzyme [Acidobacteriota bacterium]